MKTLKIIPIFMLLLFCCSAQENPKDQDSKAIVPKENVQVNKEYDEFGNLIKFDSIYSYSYSSNGKINDSLFLKIQEQFSKNRFFSDTFKNDFFAQDSNFFQNDFFSKGFFNHNQQINQMMKRMDSLQQLFFNQNQRAIIPPEPESRTKKMKFSKI